MVIPVGGWMDLEKRRRTVEGVKNEVMDADAEEEVVSSLGSPVVGDACFDSELRKEKSVAGRTSGPTRRSTKGNWTAEEDKVLSELVKRYNGKNWKKVAEYLPGRKDVQCLHRWQKVLNPELIKGAWTKEEDQLIIELVEKHGCKRWSTIAKSLPGRIGKQCRERWHNHLNPAIKRDAWTEEEEIVLIRAHREYGNKWAEIAKHLPGRADNAIKNHWNCSVKKKLDSYIASGLLDQTLGSDPNENNDMIKVEPPKTSFENQNSSGTMLFGKKGRAIAVSSKYAIHEDARKQMEDIGFKPTPIEDLKKHSGSKVQTCAVDSISSNALLKCANNSDKGGAPQGGRIGFSCVDSPYISNSMLSDYSGSFSQSNGYGFSERLWRQVFAMGSSTMRNASPDINHKLPDFSVHGCDDGVIVDKPDHNLVTPEHLKGGNSGQLHHLPLQRSGSEGSTDVLSSRAESCCVQEHSPLDCSTPPNLSLGISLNGGCPETILRSKAKSFTNTPSILRKRRHDYNLSSAAENTGQAVVDAKTFDCVCDEDVDTTLKLAPFCQSGNNGHQASLGSEVLNAWQLSLSSEKLQKTKSSSSLKSIEKRLEYEFDLEWMHANNEALSSKKTGRVDSSYASGVDEDV